MSLYNKKVKELAGMMKNDPIFCFPYGENFLIKAAQDFIVWGESQNWKEIGESRYLSNPRTPKGKELL